MRRFGWDWQRVLVRAAVLVASLAGLARGTEAERELVLENDAVQRVLIKENDVWRTIYVARADGSDKVEMESSEFRLKLMDGTELTIADYQAEGAPVSSKKESGMGSSITINYVPRGQLPPDAPKSIAIKYYVDKGPYLRKTLILAMREGGAIDELQVENFKTRLPCDLGGKRAPVFMGDCWFAGLEYPGCVTSRKDGLVQLSHYPGLVKKKDKRPANGLLRARRPYWGRASRAIRWSWLLATMWNPSVCSTVI